MSRRDASTLSRRRLLAGAGLLLAAAALPSVRPAAAERLLEATLRRAGELPQLHGLLLARDGEILVERRFRGPRLEQPVNVKSLSKTVLSALVGAAIDRGLLQGPEQRAVPLLGPRVPSGADPRLGEITLGNLLSMQAGLERTSGANYGRWVTSRDWVGHVLSQPFVDEPGGRMLYSTGSSHLVSAILTEVSGRSTLALAREWLGEPLGIEIPPWPRDPQGVYFGGNDMLLSPYALLRLGQAYLDRGRYRGRQVVPERWIAESWTPRTRSPFTGHAYGYGWFLAKLGGRHVHYGWGFGGQMLYVVPEAGLTAVMTSDHGQRSGGAYVRTLHALLGEGLIPAVQSGAG